MDKTKRTLRMVLNLLMFPFGLCLFMLFSIGAVIFIMIELIVLCLRADLGSKWIWTIIGKKMNE
jgi:hypothetical protein